MKKIFLILLVLLSIKIYSQNEDKLSYQAIIRDNSNKLIKNSTIGIKISILQGSINGNIVYFETQSVLTNENGLLSIEIGSGAGFNTIDWSNKPYFVKTEIDVTGGTNYILTATSQLLTVPFALFANKVALTKNGKAMELYIRDDGNIISKVAISVEYPYSEQPNVTDIENNKYSTVKIGNQIWMAENLKTTKLNDGIDIPNVIDNNDWINLNTPAYCWYGNDTANKSIYGALYNWYTVNTDKLCPIGWHAPTYEDISELRNYLGDWNLAGGRLKNNETIYWENNVDAINDSKFNAKPGGLRAGSELGGVFGEISFSAWFWSIEEYAPDGRAWFLGVNGSDSRAEIHDQYKTRGLSVRCIKN